MAKADSQQAEDGRSVSIGELKRTPLKASASPDLDCAPSLLRIVPTLKSTYSCSHLVIMNHSNSGVHVISPAPEGITLRVMKASDLPHVRVLHVSTSFTHANLFVSPDSPFMQRNLLSASYPAAFFVQLLVNPRRLCVVATEGSTIIGFASAAIGLLQPSSPPDTWADRDYSETRSDIPRSHVTLLTLGVLPAYQRKGIGRALVHRVIQHLEGSRSSLAPRPYTHASTNHIPNQDNRTFVLVQVQVAPSNSVGKCFYTHLGMMDQRVADDPRYHLGPASQTSVMAGVLCV